MLLDKKRQAENQKEVPLIDLKMTNIIKMNNNLSNVDSTADLRRNDKPEELFLDALFQDLGQYNKVAFEESDSDDELYEKQNIGNLADTFPSVNVFQDIGPLSRTLLKISDEKQVRKRLSKSYMYNYWNKVETKDLNEDLIVGCIANKVPVTPLLYTLQLNQEKL